VASVTLSMLPSLEIIKSELWEQPTMIIVGFGPGTWGAWAHNLGSSYQDPVDTDAQLASFDTAKLMHRRTIEASCEGSEDQ